MSLITLPLTLGSTEVTVQIWLHRLQDRHQASSGQSLVARQLLKLACQSNGIELGSEVLNSPGLELIDLLEQKHKLAASISHCRQLVAIGLSRSRLGIDCEALGRHNNCQGIADNYFTPHEAETIRNSGKKMEEVFLRHWVLKESMIKANKGSVLTNLNQLAISDEFASVSLDAAATEVGPWRVWAGRFADCFLGLSCATVNRPELTFFESPDPASGAYAPCDDLLKGTFITLTQSAPGN